MIKLCILTKFEQSDNIYVKFGVKYVDMCIKLFQHDCDELYGIICAYSCV